MPTASRFHAGQNFKRRAFSTIRSSSTPSLYKQSNGYPTAGQFSLPQAGTPLDENVQQLREKLRACAMVLVVLAPREP